jgi:hypothetical protein
VEKDDKGAMADVLQRSLQLTQVALQADTAAAAAADCGGDVETFILEAARQRRDASVRLLSHIVRCRTLPCNWIAQCDIRNAFSWFKKGATSHGAINQLKRPHHSLKRLTVYVINFDLGNEKA